MDFKEKILKNYEEQKLRDIANYGCASCCVVGIIYYIDTVDLYDLHSEEIWEELAVESKNFDCKSPLDFISSFNGSRDIFTRDQFENALVWWYIEHIAHEYVNKLRGDENE